MQKKFPVLYKYTTKGQVQQWQIIVEDDKFYTIEGIVDGKLTTSLPTVCTPKNVGRSNETTSEEQALAEAAAKHQKKLDKGYNEELTSEKKFFEPMLAEDYKKVAIDFSKTRVFVQPKLDGLRAINAEGKLMSRNGKPYVACPHLLLNESSEEILDGELYTHEYKNDFNKIVSLCKKQKPTNEELAESAEKVEFWAYDFPSHPGKFSERYDALHKWINKHGNGKIVCVPTTEVFSEDEIKALHAQFLAEGFEGTIVRIDAPYENKRTKNLLKFKDFIDEEFEIVGAAEGEGGRAGTIGYFWMRLDKSKPYDIDKEVNVFKSNIKGNFDYLKKIWSAKDTYVGKSATVKYFQRTPSKPDGTGNVPRFPYIVKIDRESYE